ncbi:hypothetical protein, variant [Exophiala xenobiotica]|uniref:Uncharacterized protein n=1 Tax=Exophiala xenobiotica TaxID=348802 RepID=A0A0D2BSJ3_9EURO|nr:hypothetical protein, variant [Exophiala xenobiotica]KIW55446.1 hypothetical protein, variant [Exophiala xenobiotica]
MMQHAEAEDLGVGSSTSVSCTYIRNVGSWVPVRRCAPFDKFRYHGPCLAMTLSYYQRRPAIVSTPTCNHFMPAIHPVGHLSSQFCDMPQGISNLKFPHAPQPYPVSKCDSVMGQG